MYFRLLLQPQYQNSLIWRNFSHINIKDPYLIYVYQLFSFYKELLMREYQRITITGKIENLPDNKVYAVDDLVNKLVVKYDPVFKCLIFCFTGHYDTVAKWLEYGSINNFGTHIISKVNRYVISVYGL